MQKTVSILNKIWKALDTINTSIEHRNLETYTDATRPGAVASGAGYIFFNSDDNFLNVSDGANWRDPTGAIT